jgi:hypothetical protein
MARNLPHLYAPPPVVGHGSGALFHPRVAVIPDGDIPRSWASASATTSNGRDVRVSVRLELPPATSFVKLQTGDELRPLRCPIVVAAHGDLLLIYVPLVIAGGPDPTSGQDWFVFRASRVGRPWLRRLPHAAANYCFTCSCDDPIGIVSLPGDEFIIANLKLICMRPGVYPADDERKTKVMLMRYSSPAPPPPTNDEWKMELMLYSSANDQWDAKLLAIPYYAGDALIRQPFRWKAEKFLASTETEGPMVYWVDYQYHHGLLRCNVGDDAPELRFIPLPREIQIFKHYPEAYSAVGACKGTVLFVHVENGGCFGSRKKSGGFTITTWALNKIPPDEFGWHQQVGVLRVNDELWPLPSFKNSPLPRWVPQFPLVSTQHENVLHFILQEYPSGKDDWMITVDMHRKLLQSYENRIKD